MANSSGPWSLPPRRPGPGIVARRIVRLALLIGAGYGLWELAHLFPNGASSDMDKVYLLRLVVIVIVLSAGVGYTRNLKSRELARNIALWIAVMGVLIVGYTYRDELDQVGNRVRSELVPSYPVAVEPGKLTLTASDNGGFYVVGLANGLPVEFLIDTGATDIVLSPRDATRVGIDTNGLIYSHTFETAHGIGRGGEAALSALSIGPIRFHDVAVSVNRSDMSTSLLGMSFLRRLSSFTVHGRKLTLEWQSRTSAFEE